MRTPSLMLTGRTGHGSVPGSVYWGFVKGVSGVNGRHRYTSEVRAGEARQVRCSAPGPVSFPAPPRSRALVLGAVIAVLAALFAPAGASAASPVLEFVVPGGSFL